MQVSFDRRSLCCVAGRCVVLQVVVLCCRCVAGVLRVFQKLPVMTASWPRESRAV